LVTGLASSVSNSGCCAGSVICMEKREGFPRICRWLTDFGNWAFLAGPLCRGRRVFGAASPCRVNWANG
jgi:hypothetical protein